MCHQLSIYVEPDVERKANGVLPLEQKAWRIHFHRLAVDRQSEPLLHHADIHARLPYTDLKLTADKCLKIMATVKICGTDDSCLSVRSVRLCDVIYTVLEIYIRHLCEELTPLRHIFHGLHFCGLQIGVAGLKCEAVDIADRSVELPVTGSDGFA